MTVAREDVARRVTRTAAHRVATACPADHLVIAMAAVVEAVAAATTTAAVATTETEATTTAMVAAAEAVEVANDTRTAATDVDSLAAPPMDDREAEAAADDTVPTVAATDMAVVVVVLDTEVALLRPVDAAESTAAWTLLDIRQMDRATSKKCSPLLSLSNYYPILQQSS